MCLQDMWIGQHTILRQIGAAAGEFQVPASANRIALIFGSVRIVNLYDLSRKLVTTFYSQGTVTGWAVTDTNEVPPTDNTGTITSATVVGYESILRLNASEYGSLVTQGCYIISVSGNITCWELLPDAVLADRLNQLEYIEGWPLYGLPPKQKVPNA